MHQPGLGSSRELAFPPLCCLRKKASRGGGDTAMGGSDWWFGWGGPAAEPASWREEGAANFPGEGALSAPELAREPRQPSAPTPGSGGFVHSARKVTLLIYLFTCIQPFGLDPVDTPLDFGSLRLISLAPLCRYGQLPGIHAHTPSAPPPHAQTRVGVGPHPGSGKSSKAGAGEGRRAGGRFQRSQLSFQSTLSLSGWVGPEPLKAERPPALTPATSQELSRPRR